VYIKNICGYPHNGYPHEYGDGYGVDIYLAGRVGKLLPVPLTSVLLKSLGMTYTPTIVERRKRRLTNLTRVA